MQPGRHALYVEAVPAGQVEARLLRLHLAHAHGACLLGILAVAAAAVHLQRRLRQPYLRSPDSSIQLLEVENHSASELEALSS